MGTTALPLKEKKKQTNKPLMHWHLENDPQYRLKNKSEGFDCLP